MDSIAGVLVVSAGAAKKSSSLAGAEAGARSPPKSPKSAEAETCSSAAGGEADVKFSIPKEALSLTTADGSKKLYSGSHELVFSRGNGDDATVAVAV